MITINTKQLIESKLKTKAESLWDNSKHQGWKELSTPQIKGSLGTEIYQTWLKAKGYQTRIISDEGDIEWRKTSNDPWIKDEVKVAAATLEQKADGSVNEQLWFNQIRPGQKSWNGITLVGIYPNHIKIWRKSREDWDSTYKTLSSVKNGLKHTGQNGEEQLEQVTLKKNNRVNNCHEWDLIYTDQQGVEV